MKFFFRKIRIIFDIGKWLWKSQFCNLAGLITSTKNVQKHFHTHFCDQWSISFSLKSFFQIPLTWSKYYIWCIVHSSWFFVASECNEKNTKGQIISECPFEILDFPKIPLKIWQISALESKKWSNHKIKALSCNIYDQICY